MHNIHNHNKSHQMQITVIIFMLINVANVFQMQYVIDIIINKGNKNVIESNINKNKILNRHSNNTTQVL